MRSGSRWRFAAVASVLAGAGGPLAGCGPNADPVGTPVSWWHNLQGGAIADQRPPPPGVDDPYPHVGTTPARPAVPSPAARDALTGTLLGQRYASAVTDARDPIAPAAAAPRAAPKPATGTPAGAPAAAPTAAIAAAPSGPATAAAAPNNTASSPPNGAVASPGGAASSATLAAAGDASPTPDNKPKPPPTLLTPEQQEANEPVLAMPPPPPGTVVLTTAAPLPTMPQAPPPPPAFPNFVIPATAIAPLRPAFGFQPTANLAFTPGSDVLGPRDRGALLHAATSRGGHALHVVGYGDAVSDTPSDQAAALRLGLARAAEAARVLEGFGVPRAAIRIAANPFGRGGHVEVLP